MTMTIGSKVLLPHPFDDSWMELTVKRLSQDAITGEAIAYCVCDIHAGWYSVSELEAQRGVL